MEVTGATESDIQAGSDMTNLCLTSGIQEQSRLALRQGGHWRQVDGPARGPEVGQWSCGWERTKQESGWRSKICSPLLEKQLWISDAIFIPKANRSFISASNWELCEVWYSLAAKHAYKRKHTICCEEFMPIGPTQIYTTLILTLYMNKSLLLIKLRIPSVSSCWPIRLDFFPRWWNISSPLSMARTWVSLHRIETLDRWNEMPLK